MFNIIKSYVIQQKILMEMIIVRYNLESYMMTNVGNVRRKNEDNFYFFQQINETMSDDLFFYHKNQLASLCLFGVFDGMGGEHCGEKASFLMADICKKYSLHQNFLNDDLLALCHIANERVCQEIRAVKKRMGTTASMLIFDKNVHICNVGDSPIFLFREDTLTSLYEEHTEKQFYQTIHGGQLRKKKYRLTQNIGVFSDEVTIKPYVNQMEMKDDDIFLICSDGLTDMIDEKEIRQCLSDWNENTIHELMKKALAAGGKDNITIILIKVNEEKENG